jgi:hypothetical protein
MARARTLKPSFFKNEDLADLPIEARLLFTGLWCLADREGRMLDRPRTIKAEIFPYDNFNVDDLLNGLQGKKFITRYDVEGERFIQINKFSQHQNPHPKEASLGLPEQPSETSRENKLLEKKLPEQAGPITYYPLPITSSNPSVIPLTADAEEKDPDVSRETFSEEFLEFWEHYPKQRAGSKQKSWSAWQYAVKRKQALPSEIIAGCLAYAASEEVANGFAKGCAAWLNDDRWLSNYSTTTKKTNGGKEDYFEGIIKSTMRGVAS